MKKQTNRGFVIATTILAITYSIGFLFMIKDNRIEKNFALISVGILYLFTSIMLVFYFKNRLCFKPMLIIGHIKVDNQ